MVGNIYIIIIIIKGTQKASKEHEQNANRITTTRGPSLTYGSKTRGGEKEKEESFIRPRGPFAQLQIKPSHSTSKFKSI